MKTDITITESAIKQINSLKDFNKSENQYFRISVNGGGCAGFQYNFTFTDTKEKEDLEVLFNNLTILIDKISYNLIKCSKLDYVNELIGSSFKIDNPKATSSCGCGTSFSI